MSEEAVEVSVPGLSFADALGAGSRPLLDPDNPVVFIDVSVGSHSMGRIKMELFKNLMPKCAENFRQFCTGEFCAARFPSQRAVRRCAYTRNSLECARCR